MYLKKEIHLPMVVFSLVMLVLGGCKFRSWPKQAEENVLTFVAADLGKNKITTQVTEGNPGKLCNATRRFLNRIFLGLWGGS